MSYKSRGGHGYGNQAKRGSSRSGWKGKAKYDTSLAKQSFERRPKLSQKQDLHRFATIAPDIVAYLRSPAEFDWQGVDDPTSLAKIAEKGSVHMVIKDGKAKKTHNFKVVKKTEATKEPEKIELKTKDNPIKEESSRKLPSEKEIYDRAVEMYQEENFKPKYGDSAPEVNPTKGELAEEGFLQRAKLDLMTKTDTKASRDVMDYVDNVRQELEKIGFTVEPIAGFDVSDLQY